MKKTLIVIFICLFALFSFATFIYILIDKNVEKDAISKLQKYTLSEGEKVVKEFTYDKVDYKISIYYDDTSAWSHVNVLTKKNDDYYILKKINKCDTLDDGSNMYFYKDTIYIHCIGQEGNVLEYKINKYKIEKNIRALNYVNTPNISQIHLTIDKVDESYIYLSSFKLDNTLKDGDKVKCSLTSNMCSYY